MPVTLALSSRALSVINQMTLGLRKEARTDGRTAWVFVELRLPRDVALFFQLLFLARWNSNLWSSWRGVQEILLILGFVVLVYLAKTAKPYTWAGLILPSTIDKPVDLARASRIFAPSEKRTVRKSDEEEKQQ